MAECGSNAKHESGSGLILLRVKRRRSESPLGDLSAKRSKQDDPLAEKVKESEILTMSMISQFQGLTLLFFFCTEQGQELVTFMKICLLENMRA